jgi:hypothetical protein
MTSAAADGASECADLWKYELAGVTSEYNEIRIREAIGELPEHFNLPESSAPRDPELVRPCAGSGAVRKVWLGDDWRARTMSALFREELRRAGPTHLMPRARSRK